MFQEPLGNIFGFKKNCFQIIFNIIFDPKQDKKWAVYDPLSKYDLLYMAVNDCLENARRDYLFLKINTMGKVIPEFLNSGTMIAIYKRE